MNLAEDLIKVGAPMDCLVILITIVQSRNVGNLDMVHISVDYAKNLIMKE